MAQQHSSSGRHNTQQSGMVAKNPCPGVPYPEICAGCPARFRSCRYYTLSRAPDKSGQPPTQQVATWAVCPGCVMQFQYGPLLLPEPSQPRPNRETWLVPAIRDTRFLTPFAVRIANSSTNVLPTKDGPLSLKFSLPQSGPAPTQLLVKAHRQNTSGTLSWPGEPGRGPHASKQPSSKEDPGTVRGS